MHCVELFDGCTRVYPPCFSSPSLSFLQQAASMERAPLAHRAGGMTDRVTNGNIHSEHHDKGGHHDNRGLAEGCIPSVEKRRSG